MLFIMGTGRCGTHMVRDVFNLHSDVFIPQETHWWPILFNEYGLAKNPIDRYRTIIDGCHYHYGRPMLEQVLIDAELSEQDLFDGIASDVGDEATLREYASSFYRVVASYKGASISGDKTPEYGASMATLMNIWPEAKFIHVVRDGRSVASSMEKHEGFRLLSKHGVVNWPTVAFSGANDHPLPVERGRTFKKLRGIPLDRDFKFKPFIELWALRLKRIQDEMTRVPQERVIEIRYEDILKAPKEEMEQLAKFAGVDANTSWLGKVENEIRNDNKAHAAQTMAPEVANLLEHYRYI